MKTICYAYYGDGKFLGWYADSFGSIRKKNPKLYRDSEEQNAIISLNFKSKIARIKEKSNLANRNASLIGLKVIDNSLNKEASDLSQYKQIELRSVECPIYDGPNPDFDKAAYLEKIDKRRQDLIALGIMDMPIGTTRIEAIRAYDEKHEPIATNTWIYADYKQVEEWASKEPTEFIDIITS